MPDAPATPNQTDAREQARRASPPTGPERLGSKIFDAYQSVKSTAARSMEGLRITTAAAKATARGIGSAALRTYQQTTIADVFGPRLARPTEPAFRTAPAPLLEEIGALSEEERAFVRGRAHDLAINHKQGEDIDRFMRDYILYDTGLELLDGDTLDDEGREIWEGLIEGYRSHPRIREEILERRRMLAESSL